MNRERFEIKFWGVRGSCPAPGRDTVYFGGNTPCVQVKFKNQLLIFDAGTGLRNLGNKLDEEERNITANIFLTHTHWDHIQGFPFFKPFYRSGNKFKIFGLKSIKKSLISQMNKSFFPFQFEKLQSTIEFAYLQEKEKVSLDDEITVKSMRTNHLGGNLAYRIEAFDKSCCYLTDIEHNEKDSQKIIDFVSNSDVVIYDAMYTSEEYKNYKKGWGHSTWEAGVELIKDASADTLILFHHAPSRNDKQLVEIEKKAQSKYQNTMVAREGMIISL